MMGGENISFVVQGPIVKHSNTNEGVYSTAEVLASIRNHYPKGEIILSTWKGSDLSQLIFDELVLSEDPGGFKLGGLTMNYNRLIVSSKAGILKASNAFVVKTRTDIIFTGDNLLDKLNLISNIQSEYSIFNKFVLSTIYYVRNPIKLNLVFHPSDIFLVGEKTDMLSYFDVPLAPRDFYFNEDNTTKIVAEQYFFVHSILKKRNKNYSIPRWGYINLKYFLHSERYLFNNFIFLDLKDLGIEFPKRLYSVYRPKSNYNLKQARFLFKVYKEKPLYSPMVILSRGAQYFIYHYVLYYPKVVWHNIMKPFLYKIKYFKNH